MRKIVLCLTLYFLLSTILIGCATAPRVSELKMEETVTIGGVKYVSCESLCRIFNLDASWDPIIKILILKKDEKEIRIMADSSTVLLNNVVYTMDKEAKIYQGQVHIPQSFAHKTLGPLFKEEYIARKPMPAEVVGLPIKKLIIDPGHGGKDPGAIGRGGLREKNVVLDIAKSLQNKLNAQGIEVILTRDSDNFVSLTQREKIANAHAKEADFFISIHANASRSRWAQGVEVFYLSEDIDDNLRSLKAAANYDLNLKEGYCGKNTLAILWDLTLTENRRESKRLSNFVCESLSRNLYQKNRGVKPARFYVLNAYIPAVLIEVGFISNLQEEKRLQDAAYRDKIAQSIAEGILQFNRSLTQSQYTRY